MEIDKIELNNDLLISPPSAESVTDLLNLCGILLSLNEQLTTALGNSDQAKALMIVARMKGIDNLLNTMSAPFMRIISKQLSDIVGDLNNITADLQSNPPNWDDAMLNHVYLGTSVDEIIAALMR